jgi:hypothetical protein
LIFGDEISSTPPSQNMPSLISVLKLLRKLSWAVAESIGIATESTVLSLIVFASSINRLFGGEAGSVVDVVHMIGAGDGPGTVFVATHPAGRAGAVTVSKNSVKLEHGVAVAVAVGVLVDVAVGEPVGVLVAVGVAPSVIVKFVFEISK